MRKSINVIAFAGIVLTVAASGMARRSAPLLPDPNMTPGDTLPVTSKDVCVPGYSKKIRDVPEAVKKQVYAEYGITSHAPHEYEVDHLISLEIGGSNSIKNLWPQSYKTQPWNATVKDKLENELHRQVCSNQLDLKTAQQDISRDWISAYKKYFHTNMPLARGQKPAGRHGRSQTNSKPRGNRNATINPPGNNARVWVNTGSGKYFLPGSRYYGKTKAGKYMSEADALKQGYHAAKEK